MTKEPEMKSAGNSPRFFNRELSWIEFNARVLEEGLDKDVPLLERIKFLSIVSSNFDEFFMVRVATIKRHVRENSRYSCPTGIEPEELLTRISERVHELVETQYRCTVAEILPELTREGIIYVGREELDAELQRYAANRFDNNIFYNLTPIRVEKERPFPFATSLRIHILFALRPEEAPKSTSMEYAMVQIPPGLERIQWLKEENGKRYFTILGDIIIANAEKLFRGYRVEDHCLFRITRDADLSVDEERDEDFIAAMEEVLAGRQYSLPVRLEISSDASRDLKEILHDATGISDEDIYAIPGLFDLSGCMSLVTIPGFPHLKYEEWSSSTAAPFHDDAPIWDILKRKDILLHHPYESFDPVIRLVEEAADDPDVQAIKMTLYRTSGSSPITAALIRAVEAGKQVTVLVEVKARFDEERNISWAEKLQRAGAIVIYGLAHLKVHSKALLIIRQELEGIQLYAHFSTGNYNEKTARLYTDIGVMTTNSTITLDTVQFFNTVTGYSSIQQLNKLIMSPNHIKSSLLQMISREAERSTPENRGLIVAKMNSLADEDIIEALYDASCRGVKIRLNIRGICMLVPGVQGMSENIEVVSIVDRYLEHSRIFYFQNQGMDEIYISSADWMPRNLVKRIELMLPVENQKIKKKLKEILFTFFRDTVKARHLTSRGRYIHQNKDKRKPFRCQDHFNTRARNGDSEENDPENREFIVRRSPHSANM